LIFCSGAIEVFNRARGRMRPKAEKSRSSDAGEVDYGL